MLVLSIMWNLLNTCCENQFVKRYKSLWGPCSKTKTRTVTYYGCVKCTHNTNGDYRHPNWKSCHWEQNKMHDHFLLSNSSGSTIIIYGNIMKWNNYNNIERLVKVRIQTHMCVELRVNSHKYRVPTLLQWDYYNWGHLDLDKVDRSDYGKITIHSEKASCQS